MSADEIVGGNAVQRMFPAVIGDGVAVGGDRDLAPVDQQRAGGDLVEAVVSGDDIAAGIFDDHVADVHFIYRAARVGAADGTVRGNGVPVGEPVGGDAVQRMPGTVVSDGQTVGGNADGVPVDRKDALIQRDDLIIRGHVGVVSVGYLHIAGAEDIVITARVRRGDGYRRRNGVSGGEIVGGDTAHTVFLSVIEEGCAVGSYNDFTLVDRETEAAAGETVVSVRGALSVHHGAVSARVDELRIIAEIIIDIVPAAVNPQVTRLYGVALVCAVIRV